MYNLKLNEVFDTPTPYYVIRVPGGWIYYSLDGNGNVIQNVFVPYNNEFQGE